MSETRTEQVLLEKLAALEHDQWVAWASSILRTERGISRERRARWAALLVTPYAELSETDKERDRKWARRSLDLFQGYVPDPPPEPEPREEC